MKQKSLRSTADEDVENTLMAEDMKTLMAEVIVSQLLSLSFRFILKAARKSPKTLIRPTFTSRSQQITYVRHRVVYLNFELLKSIIECLYLCV